MSGTGDRSGRRPLEEATPRPARGRTRTAKGSRAAGRGRSQGSRSQGTRSGAGGSNDKNPAGKKKAPAGKKKAPAGRKKASARNKQAPARNKQAPARNKQAPARNKKAPAAKKDTAPGKAGSGEKDAAPAPAATTVAANTSVADPALTSRARTLLAKPDSSGPRVTLGLGWFVLVVAAVFLGRWALLGLWGSVAGFAAVQVGRGWRAQPRSADMPSWAPTLAALGAVLCAVAASVGTALGGIALIATPLLVVGVVTVAGRKPVSSAGALIGLVLAAVPAMSVVLVAREGWQPALFLVAAVSFYDAGYFIGAAESSSRLEGPVTGAIGLLAVTFAASAFEVVPFDRITAWIAGGAMVFACPLGQMLVSAEMPSPTSSAPAMRRLDSSLVAAPLMLGAVWALS